MARFAQFILRRRLLILIVIAGITGFFVYEAVKLPIFTNYRDILPQQKSHPYMKTYDEYSSLLGGANVLLIVVQAKKGTIFEPAILKKIKRIGQELEILPGIDIYKIISIARRKVKNVETTAWGIKNIPIMWPKIPKTKDELERLKKVIYSNDTVYGPLVSLDSKSALIMADFFEKGIDYKKIFYALKKIQEKEEDELASVHIAGYPMLLGYLRYYMKSIVEIFIVTVGAICLLLALIFRSVRGVLCPLIAAAVSAVWGLGFMSFVGYNLDPLALVLPFLISAMAISHSIQVISRFYKEFTHVGTMEACSVVVKTMFKPGVTGIITDACGFIAISIIPITLLQKIGFSCLVWSVSTIVVAFILVPIILSYFPSPRKNASQEVGGQVLKVVLNGVATLVLRTPKAIIAVSVIIVVLGAYFAVKVQIGATDSGGSSLFWPDSRYNKDAAVIGQNFYGSVYPLYVFVDGKRREFIVNREVLLEMERFQRYMFKKGKGDVQGTLSVIDYGKKFNRKLHEDDPKFEVIPATEVGIGGTFSMLVANADPGDYDKFFTPKLNAANIIVYCKDRTNKVVQHVCSLADKFIEGSSFKDVFKLAGGVVGVEKATNDVVTRSQLYMLLGTIGFVFLCCTVAFRSFIAGGILCIPLIFSNIILFAYMYLAKIGLDISTLPVASVGMGLGVDFGIYLLAKMMEEKEGCELVEEIISRSLLSTGRAVIVVVSTLAIGVIFWWWSDLMFQAKMGYLLAFVLVLNCLGALLIVPAVIFLTKPRFLLQR